MSEYSRRIFLTGLLRFSGGLAYCIMLGGPSSQLLSELYLYQTCTDKLSPYEHEFVRLRSGA